MFIYLSLAMTNKLVVIINSLKIPNFKKILLWNETPCAKIQLPPATLTNWLHPPIPLFSVLCPQLNLLNHPIKILLTPLVLAIVNLITLTSSSLLYMQYGKHNLNICNKIESFKPYLYISTQLWPEFVTNVKNET